MDPSPGGAHQFNDGVQRDGLGHHRDARQAHVQAGGELVQVNPAILQGMSQVMKTATAGMGASLAWPALLRKCDRMDPSYKT